MNATEALQLTDSSEVTREAIAMLTDQLLEAIREAAGEGLTQADVYYNEESWLHAARVVAGRFQAQGFETDVIRTTRYGRFESARITASWWPTLEALLERESAETNRSEKEQA